MEASEPAELQVIKSHYEKAFECLDAGLLEDKAGNKGRAVVLYRLGRRHLLQGLEVATRGEHCAGADWDCARQMQLKMNETLSSITTRLAVLETACQGASGAQPLYPSLPVLQQPQRPARRPILNSRLSPTASGGVPFLPSSPVTASDVPSELPPAYTPQPTDGHFSLSHSEGKDWPSLPRPKQISRHQSLNEGGEDLLFLPYGVQIFFVTADGQVSAPSYPGYLRIILNDRQRHRDSNDISDIRQPPAYLQVCDWHYPLFPDSPVLLSNTGVFTFPDTTAAVPGSYVGVVLSSELSATDRALFQEHLSVLTQLRVQAADDEAGEPTGTDVVNLNEKAPISPSSDTATAMDTSPGKEENILPEWSEKMSQSILAGASWLSRGLVQGAEVTGKAIHKGASKLREHITPEETPAEVSPRVTRGLYVAKQATGGAVKVSNFLVDGLSSVVELVGKELAPHVKKHGSKLIPESLKKNKDACTNMGGAKVVAASSLKGLSTLWSGLETAAKTIGKSASSETVLTVKHKYGEEAGQATDTAVQSVVDVGVTAFNMDNIAVKAVLKGAGKQTSKALAEEDETMEPEKAAKRKEQEKK
ncbi:spartin a isoform X1 [Pygocentrus nattereri]|uniref:Spartin n=1 Tax=Pygocentrus nattereri TaxID=42514 RepID=A0AAR2JSQ8_PYGNA|nr:spartin a isoform X1 [Pygocentrus nattereri]